MEFKDSQTEAFLLTGRKGKLKEEAQTAPSTSGFALQTKRANDVVEQKTSKNIITDHD